MKNKLCAVWQAVYPTLLLTLLHILFSQAAYYLALPDEKEILLGYNGMRHIVVSAVIFLCFYYSFVRLQTVYNKPLREEYIKAEGNIGYFKSVVCGWDFWLNIFAFAITVFAFDLNKTYSLLYEYFEGSKLTAFGIAMPCLIIINLLARYNARKQWNRSIGIDEKIEGYSQKPKSSAHSADKLIPAPPSLAAMRFITRTGSGTNPAIKTEPPAPPSYDRAGRIRTYLLVIAMYVFCVFAGTIMYTIASFVLIPFFMISFAKTLTGIIAFIIVMIPIVRRIKALVKRYGFISKLKRLCKESKQRLSVIKAPYASLFSIKGGESFTVTANQKTYSCKMLSCIKKSTPIVLNENGSGAYIHAFVFAGIKWFERTRYFNFGYESSAQQILIINPASKFICKEHNGAITELDNGDCVGKYIVYTAGGFLNSLDRGTLGVVEKKKGY